MLKRLRLRFVCVMMALFIALLGVIFGLIYHFTASNLEAESMRTMESLAEDPFQTSSLGDASVHLPYFVLQVGWRGELVATGGYFDLSDQDFLLELVGIAFAAEEDSGILKDYNLRFLRRSSYGQQCVVFVDISGEISTLRSLRVTFLLIGGGALLLFALISVLLARWMVKPVDRAWQQQKQFVSDAGHELKTPLTVITTNAELLLSPEQGEADRANYAGNILTMSRRMRTLVEGLLDLARTDNGVVRTHAAPLDFSELAADAVLPFEPVFFEKGLSLRSEIEPGLRVNGSEPYLRQMIDILLDNAQKYSAAETETSLTLRRKGKRCLLTVASHGETLSPEERKRIFQRFYQVDAARSAGGSYGLGLSIAEGIVREHRGRIWCESEDGLNSFLVELPLL